MNYLGWSTAPIIITSKIPENISLIIHRNPHWNYVKASCRKQAWIDSYRISATDVQSDIPIKSNPGYTRSSIVHDSWLHVRKETMRDIVFFCSIQKSSGKLLGSMTFESNSATFLKVSAVVVFSPPKNDWWNEWVQILRNTWNSIEINWSDLEREALKGFSFCCCWWCCCLIEFRFKSLLTLLVTINIIDIVIVIIIAAMISQVLVVLLSKKKSSDDCFIFFKFYFSVDFFSYRRKLY